MVEPRGRRRGGFYDATVHLDGVQNTFYRGGVLAPGAAPRLYHESVCATAVKISGRFAPLEPADLCGANSVLQQEPGSPPSQVETFARSLPLIWRWAGARPFRAGKHFR